MIEIALTDAGKAKIQEKNIVLPKGAKYLSMSFKEKYILVLDKEKHEIADLSNKLADRIIFNELLAAETE